MIRNIVAIAALIVAGIGQANASTLSGNLFLQDWDSVTAGTIASQVDTNPSPPGFGAFATAYDNFTLGSTSTVQSVSWVGGYFNPPPALGPISSFTISFYDNTGGSGLPGALLATDTVPYGASNETFLAIAGSTPVPSYSYDANITPFTAVAGTEYWMSIVANMPYPPQWGWETSSSVLGTFAQAFPAPPAYYPGELAFGLSSSSVGAVPEPATVTMAFIGVVGMAGFMLMRRRRIAVAA